MTNENSQAQSVAELDLGVSARQAFGTSWQKPKDLQKRLDAYWEGKLILPPQPTWQGDPTDWAADPFGDRNWRFQHHTLRWLNPLRWVALDGDEKAQREWVRVVRSWADANIPAKDSPSDFAWKDMADGNRAIQLSLGVPLVSPDDEWFLELLRYHRDWLCDVNNIASKNHAMHQHSGLLVVAATLRDRKAMDLAVSRLTDLFALTFDLQGANDEGSAGYHQLNMVWWEQTWQRVENEGIEPPVGVRERFSAAAKVLGHMVMPNGHLPQIGDGGRTKVRAGLSSAADYSLTGGKEGTPLNDTTLVLDRGYVFSRSGWGETRPIAEESHMVIRFGHPIKPRSHSHYDRGSVHIYSNGQPWLVDSGFHSYQPSAPENKYLISRGAHNLPSIVGSEHTRDAEVELVDSVETVDYHAFTLRDYGYDGKKLQRRVIYLVGPDCWLIADSVESENSEQVEHNWFVEPDTTVRHLDTGFRLDGHDGSFAMHWLGQGTQLSLKRASENSLEGWIGMRWKTLVPGAKIAARSRPGVPHLVGLFGSHRSVPLSVVESHVAMNGHIRIYIGRGDSYWHIDVGTTAITIR